MSNMKCKGEIFDTGIYAMESGCTGKYVMIRRIGLPSTSDLVYNIAEVRLYQSTNVLATGTPIISGPDPISAAYKA